MEIEKGEPPFLLSDAASAEPMFAAIARLVAAKGVDPAATFLADFFSDDHSFYFGLLATRDGRAFQFGYDHLNRSRDDGTLSEWDDLTKSWRESRYATEIGRALEFARAAT